MLWFEGSEPKSSQPSGRYISIESSQWPASSWFVENWKSWQPLAAVLSSDTIPLLLDHDGASAMMDAKNLCVPRLGLPHVPKL